MCMPSGSLKPSPLFSRKVLFNRKIVHSVRLRAEAHCHELNRGFSSMRNWPMQSMDFFMATVYSQFTRKNR